jgi:hypothetical protein
LRRDDPSGGRGGGEGRATASGTDTVQASVTKAQEGIHLRAVEHGLLTIEVHELLE